MIEPLSIIVPVYNSQATLKRCLTSLIQAMGSQDEIIVVNDGSQDASLDIALSYPIQLVNLDRNAGVSRARNLGAAQARYRLLLFVDSDIEITKETLEVIRAKLSSSNDLGTLSVSLDCGLKEENFPTRYKNLYMNFIFSQCGEEVNFVYGSCCGTLKENFIPWPEGIHYGEDSLWGYQQWKLGRRVKILKGITVRHLKHYNLNSLLKNDFKIASFFAVQFIENQRWKAILGSEKFGHTSQGQIISLLLALLSSSLMFFWSILSLIPLSVWLILNYQFFNFVLKKTNMLFAFKSVIWTFIDHHVYLLGVVWGTSHYLIKPKRKI